MIQVRQKECTKAVCATLEKQGICRPDGFPVVQSDSEQNTASKY